MLRRTFLLGGVALLGALGAHSAFAQDAVPAGYPAEYAALIEEAKKETDLVIYTNLQLSNWAKVLEDFKAKYSWTDVKVVDLGAETFERYYAETATNGRTADFILAGGADNWVDFVKKAGAVDYVSPEAKALPEWGQASPGIYTVATDPAVIVYNKQIIPEAEAPKSLHAIAELLKKKPDLANRLTAQSVAVPFGRTATWAWVQHNPDAWDVLGVLGPATRPERAVGGILEKVATGEHAIAWFVNASALFAKVRDPAVANLLGWSFIEDGTPIVPRRIAIPKNTQRPATAKLMMDFLLSREGQIAFGQTGVTPYRPDVKKEEVLDQTYGSIVEAVGEKNVAFDRDDNAYVAGRDAFVEKWRSVFTQAKQ